MPAIGELLDAAQAAALGYTASADSGPSWQIIDCRGQKVSPPGQGSKKARQRNASRRKARARKRAERARADSSPAGQQPI